jgi:hypothetical protein
LLDHSELSTAYWLPSHSWHKLEQSYFDTAAFNTSL